jgi:hypothetical protein
MSVKKRAIRSNSKGKVTKRASSKISGKSVSAEKQVNYVSLNFSKVKVSYTPQSGD